MPSCPLCQSEKTREFFSSLEKNSGFRRYFDCPGCRLIFLDPACRLNRQDERGRYDLHQNSPEDDDYVRFLRQLADPLLERVRPKAHGLDYGCGPGPTLDKILAEKGFRVKIYDPFYAPDTRPLEDTYDFITLSEVPEHFYDPLEQFSRLCDLLKDPGGILAVMTEMWREQCRFGAWHYRREPAHVCFYTPETFRWIARNFGLELEIFSERVLFLYKKNGEAGI